MFMFWMLISWEIDVNKTHRCSLGGQPKSYLKSLVHDHNGLIEFLLFPKVMSITFGPNPKSRGNSNIPHW